jgi:hypothetical protein
MTSFKKTPHQKRKTYLLLGVKKKKKKKKKKKGEEEERELWRERDARRI